MKMMAVMAVMMGFAFSAMGQNTANKAISGKAIVMQAITVTNQVDLDFGIIAQGANKTIGLTNNVTGWNEGTQSTGRFLVSAAATTSIDLAFTVPTDLVKGSDVLLPIDTYTYGWDVTNDYATGTTLVNGGDVTMPTNLVETVNGIYVFVGATVKPGPSQAIGSYAADITLTATYN